MPLGEPPAKPSEDASEADFAKYRQDFEAYVAQKLAEFGDLELKLEAREKGS